MLARMDVSCMTVKNTRGEVLNETPDDVPNITFTSTGSGDQKGLTSQKELLRTAIDRLLQSPAI